MWGVTCEGDPVFIVGVGSTYPAVKSPQSFKSAIPKKAIALYLEMVLSAL